MASLASIKIQFRLVITARAAQVIQHVSQIFREDTGYCTGIIHGHIRFILKPRVVDVRWTLARFYGNPKVDKITMNYVIRQLSFHENEKRTLKTYFRRILHLRTEATSTLLITYRHMQGYLQHHHQLRSFRKSLSSSRYILPNCR